MGGLWKSEMERMWRQKSLIILFLIGLALIAYSLIKLKLRGYGDYGSATGRELLNRGNLPWYLLDSISLLSTTILLPLLYTDHICSEFRSGAYRVYLQRPYRMSQFWLVKLGALVVTTLGFVAMAYLMSSIGALFLFPQSSEAAPLVDVKQMGSSLSTLLIYIMFALACISKLIITGVVCLYFGRSIFAFVVVTVFSLIIYQFHMGFLILIDPFQSIRGAFQSGKFSEFWIFTLGSIGVGGLWGLAGWCRRVLKK
ncbi:hypothetical protein DCC85_10285 [Paenibacillus sp. CAA11]|uniref:hypothetical protein n=1 Tax=Paenibacillus sp. CAA11 TaxID=1532905 RepID=UPI000D37D2B3|nr:hypothetical protein [Paenibacillus sp. CAA11]AWB44576.1 hypothetical protein DCC85_10285 [Paenibacillus sp. CAA11]